MNKSEFATQMARMQSVYSDKAYPSERMDMIWEEMRYLPVVQFSDIVGEMIANCGQAPMIGKFREAKNDLWRKNSADYESQENSWLDNQPDCHDCGKTGAILATHKKTLCVYAFGCPCKIGERRHPKLPLWKAANFMDYYSGTTTETPKGVLENVIPRITMKKIPLE